MRIEFLESNDLIKCIYSGIPTCKKGFNNFRKINDFNRGKKLLLEEIDTINRFKIAGSINEEDELDHSDNKLQQSLLFQFTNPGDYLNQIRKYMSTDIISQHNFGKIDRLAHAFQGNITSFFGFETKLNSMDTNSDYLFAISSRKGEREALLQILEEDILSNNQFVPKVWKRIYDFTKQWTDTNSIIHKNVLGLWFEFDTANSHDGFPIPNIFLQTRKIRIDNEKDEKEFRWITQNAIPTLTGTRLSPQANKKTIESIKKLPEGTAIIHIGTMLARQTNGVRIVINRIKPKDIIPYLKNIGFHHTTEKLEEIINELNRYVSRMILHINISDSVDKKIGIECSFAYDQYHEEKNWEDFLNYLEENNLCIPEKKEALLDFIGVDMKQPEHSFSADDYMPSVMINRSHENQALVRYISHIKVVFEPNKPLTVKAYPGVRLLGSAT